MNERAESDRGSFVSKDESQELIDTKMLLQAVQSKASRASQDISLIENEVSQLRFINLKLVKDNKYLTSQLQIDSDRIQELSRDKQSLQEQLLKHMKLDDSQGCHNGKKNQMNRLQFIKTKQLIAIHTKLILETHMSSSASKNLTKSIREISLSLDQALAGLSIDNQGTNKENAHIRQTQNSETLEEKRTVIEKMKSQMTVLKEKMKDISDQEDYKLTIKNKDAKIKLLNDHISVLQHSLVEQNEMVDHMKRIIQTQSADIFRIDHSRIIENQSLREDEDQLVEDIGILDQEILQLQCNLLKAIKR